MSVDNNDYCVGCPFITSRFTKCPLYDEILERDKYGKILRLDICKLENKTKLGEIK